jgi:hypothetical protein
MFLVLGSPRSGTTLLAQSLDAHPEIVVPDETDFIIPSAFVFDRIADVAIRKRLLTELIVNSVRFQFSIGQYLSPSDVLDIVSLCGDRMDNLLVGLYGAVAAKGNGIVGGDKTPNVLLFLRMLVKVGGLTPAIRIIHIIRDVRDVMSSLLPLNWTNDLEVYFPRFWGNSNLYLYSLFHDKPEYMRVTYEDFVRTPEIMLERVCAHVGVEFRPEQLLPERRHPRYREVAPHARLYQPITGAAVGGFRQKLSADTIEAIERQAAEAMTIFGYGFDSPWGRKYRALGWPNIPN